MNNMHSCPTASFSSVFCPSTMQQAVSIVVGGNSAARIWNSAPVKASAAKILNNVEKHAKVCREGEGGRTRAHNQGKPGVYTRGVNC